VLIFFFIINEFQYAADINGCIIISKPVFEFNIRNGKLLFEFVGFFLLRLLEFQPNQSIKSLNTQFHYSSVLRLRYFVLISSNIFNLLFFLQSEDLNGCQKPESKDQGIQPLLK